MTDRPEFQTGVEPDPQAVYETLPLVYACSGCSSSAQLANDLAIRLDRERRAEMSCIAGVGGDVRHLLKVAQSGRPILALDGCALHCVAQCLRRHAIAPDAHLDFSKAGIRKRFHDGASPEERNKVWVELILPALERLRKQTG